MSRIAVAGLLSLISGACSKGPAPRARDAGVAVIVDAAPAVDAAAAAAVPVDAAVAKRGASGLMPVVVIDEVEYVLLDDGAGPQVEWGEGPTTAVAKGHGGAVIAGYGREVKLRAATRAPAPVASKVGTTITGYGASGAPCPLTIESLHLLGDYLNPEGEVAETFLLLGRLAPHACKPVVVSERPPARIFPRVTPSAAQRRALVAAFRALPSYPELARQFRWGNAPPRVALFRDDEKQTVRAIVGMESSLDCDGGHGSLRAMFELAAGAKPALVAETDSTLGTKVLAMLDADGDGQVELVIGPVSSDDGGSGTTSLGSIWDWADPSNGPDVGFSYYTGCD